MRKVLASKSIRTQNKNRLSCEWIRDDLGESYRCYEGEKFIWGERLPAGSAGSKDDFQAFLELAKECK